jgi:hypothetical protein
MLKRLFVQHKRYSEMFKLHQQTFMRYRLLLELHQQTFMRLRFFWFDLVPMLCVGALPGGSDSG